MGISFCLTSERYRAQLDSSAFGAIWVEPFWFKSKKVAGTFVNLGDGYYYILTLLFAGVVVLVLIHVCIVVKAFGRVNEDRDLVQSIYTGTRSMPREEVRSLPSFHYKEAKRGANLVDCAVCLESFKVCEHCRLLPNCSHSFHVRCIDSWIMKTTVCPIYRSWVNSRIVPTVSTLTQESKDRIQLV